MYGSLLLIRGRSRSYGRRRLRRGLGWRSRRRFITRSYISGGWRGRRLNV